MPKAAAGKKGAPTREDRDKEKRDLLGEIAFFLNQQDAIKDEINIRKERLLLLMAQDGDRQFEHEGVGSAGFKTRRSFKVKDPKVLAKMFSKEVLAENMKVTAAFYDAADREGYRIDTAITVGEDESLNVSRATTKAAKKIRKAQILEAKKLAAQKLSDYRKKLRRF